MFRRIPFLLVLLVALFALPAVAEAHAPTKLSGVKSYYSYDASPDSTATSCPAVSGALYVRNSRGKYVRASGTVRLYHYDAAGVSSLVETQAVTTTKGYSFQLKDPGQYRLYYAGSGTRKSCSAYTYRRDCFIDLGTPTLQVSDNGDGTFRVSETIAVTWDKGTYTGPVFLVFDAELTDSNVPDNPDAEVSMSTMFLSTLFAPGSRTFSFTATAEELNSFVYYGVSATGGVPFLLPSMTEIEGYQTVSAQG